MEDPLVAKRSCPEDAEMRILWGLSLPADEDERIPSDERRGRLAGVDGKHWANHRTMTPVKLPQAKHAGAWTAKRAPETTPAF